MPDINLQTDYWTTEYWNNRVLRAPNDKDMIFLDGRRKLLWERVEKRLREWSPLSMMDICCGFGKFSVAEDYLGIDFSEEMIKLANKKFPNKSFIVGDVYKLGDLEPKDIVFEVNSLHSMRMTPEQFYEKVKGYSKKKVVCFEADNFYIWEDGILTIENQTYDR